ncbi:MAG: UDP-N-acetylglucosamine 2-epimerase (non-hydrolyzing) [Anaerolineae bacterium]|jgi:UDP-N-acetylglucosamine 2-epimerase (non-hydrolysing)|nr:UDP-N-acetylglucosamine 2-epimerase (non-hydrolyzing) [Anaerolineae bacterium]MBT7072682.1 UDP-N-acetylglucosamine 2-epimerase (non-hydrolyzing) [Anaerolineae bacterium]MBT7326863.1 UDP-N-acetylglucosamine 2-epimerase (non-hydrolyzing) [Anaerolineae bacterium]
MKVLSIFGTRPEAIKMAPVVRELAQTPGIESRVCVTAQHREMLDQVLTLFDIQPDVDLNLMRPDQSLAELTARVFTHLDPVLADIQPDWVLVQGDTTTVMAAALNAYYRRIRVGHVEAGLRTHNKWEPFPEEVNRRVAGVAADIHFAPTKWSRQNLLKEGVPEDIIYVTGNPVIDALYFVAEQPVPTTVASLLSKLRSKRLILVTAHRRENHGEPIKDICAALKSLALRSDVEIVYPVHLNPNVQKPVKRLLGNIPNITLLPPLEYLPLVHLMKKADLILTDSGGIQEEAPAFGVPVLVLRDVTERPEGIQAGTLKLVGTNQMKIVNEANYLLNDSKAHAAMAQAVNPFGMGDAAKKIVANLLKFGT